MQLHKSIKLHKFEKIGGENLSWYSLIFLVRGINGKKGGQKRLKGVRREIFLFIMGRQGNKWPI
jgi:hypothetical protein